MYGEPKLTNMLDVMAYVEDDEVYPALNHPGDNSYSPIIMVRVRDDGMIQWVYGPKVGTDLLSKSVNYNPVTESHWMEPTGFGHVARWVNEYRTCPYCKAVIKVTSMCNCGS